MLTHTNEFLTKFIESFDESKPLLIESGTPHIQVSCYMPAPGLFEPLRLPGEIGVVVLFHQNDAHQS